ncbi:MAG: 2-succinyl-5-enolpyruvyl-6-hydroxy-3-cyclohexene-1-carboxylic-acid synthase [Myxococcota bacterium]
MQPHTVSLPSRNRNRNPNCNYAFAHALFEELQRGGVEQVCVCPGSRSAPLAIAAARQPGLKIWSHIDERSAAFFALGQAKATRAPVALVCTSGSAAANFHPAVIEAHYARVPLIVLTADRPPEAWDWGTGQTIDQLRLYGSHVRWFALAPPPEVGRTMLRYARVLACRAVAEATGHPWGPVHLNIPFREPLDPTPAPDETPEHFARDDRLATLGRGPLPYTRMRRGAGIAPASEVERLAELALRCERGVIACGPMDASPELAEAITALASATGWPVLAEPTSQLRRGPHVERGPVVAGSDLFLRVEAFAEGHAPELVLRVGAPPTSKSMRVWLEYHSPQHVLLLDPDGGWAEPSQLLSEVLQFEPTALCNALVDNLGSVRLARAESDWRRAFLAAETRCRALVDRELAAEGDLLEAQLVRDLGEALPDDALLYVSNSMPIRDLDAFLPTSPRPLRILCNRGANGIDGLLSSALGAAAQHDGPVVLFCGDLSFVHDLGALVAAQRHGLALSIVLVNNGGGGIFSRLPIAAFRDEIDFADLFQTPHGIDFGRIAAGFDIGHTRPSSSQHLRAALKDSMATPGISLIEVPVDPERSLHQLRALEHKLRSEFSELSHGLDS